jgi:hypothetical protein
MTQKEALIYIDSLSGEDLEDAVEMKLFESKQYFLTKPIISKLYAIQFKKMDRLAQAVEVLGIRNSDYQGDPFEIVFDSKLIEAFRQYEKMKADLKLKVIHSSSVNELKSIALLLLKVQFQYISMWPSLPEEILNDTLISKDPDPMDLLNELNNLQKLDVLNFQELNLSISETSVTLFNEWKRLSLLRQKELEWKKTSSIN